MFLLHFFGDLHQPMHTSGFKYGGNLVRPMCWDTPAPCTGTRSLHSVWDRDIPRKLRGLPEEPTPEESKIGAVKWAGDVFARQQGADSGRSSAVCADLDLASPRCVLQYAAESNRIVCEHAMKNGEKWLLENDLSGEYYEENAPIVDDRIGKAGVRLAAWMNEVARVLVKGERKDL